MNYTRNSKYKNKNTRKVRKLIKGGDNHKIDYLSNVCLHVDNTGKSKEELQQIYNVLLRNIMIKSFPYANGTFTDYFNKLRSDIMEKIQLSAETSILRGSKPLADMWISCRDECYNITHTSVNQEIASTAYMLRVLSNTLISPDKCKPKLQILYENLSETNGPGSSLTGKWNKDSKYFTITKVGKGDNTSRLIMGFGPSASGKTYWAKNVIGLLNKYIKNFPSTFFTIDGGDYRSLSYVYQIIIESAKKKGVGGIDNLVSTFATSSIFDSDIIKNNIIAYLNKSNLPISAYVPETLGDCGRYRPKSCKSKIEKYVNLTGDKEWVALMIYQHKYGDKCQYDLKYQCVGTTSSGKSRESDEGKKYSNISYGHSMKQGLNEITKAPNLKFIIHNSGGKKHNNDFNYSTFMDNSKKSPFTRSTAIRHNIDFENLRCEYKYIYNINKVKWN